MPDANPPDLDVRVNSARLPRNALWDIREVTVEEDLEILSMFTIVLYNWDDDRQRVSWSDDDQFAVGNQVEISLGYVDDLHPVMLAEITSLEPTFEAGKPPLLTVRGYDHRHRLARGRRTRSFTKMKDSAIAARLARDAGLGAKVHDTRTVLDYVVQSNQSDWEFLRRRAGLIGYEIYVRDKDLYFRPPPRSANASVTLAVGQDVTSFTPRLSSLGQVDEVAVRGWDAKRKEPVLGRAKIGQEIKMGGRRSGPRTARRAFGKASAPAVGLPVRAKAEADQVALGRFNDLALTYVQGEVVCGGRPQLHAGTVVDISGAGRTFSGLYYVTAVTHSVSEEQGYQTRFTVRRNAA